MIDRPHVVTVAGEVVDIHRNPIIVWIPIDNVHRLFPAILDTGHGHNLSISRRQGERWSGARLRRIGELELARETVVQDAADVRLRRNVSRQADLRGEAYLLDMPQGISVFEEGSPVAPRLPLVGLRTSLANRLRLSIDGNRRWLTIKTSRWF
jgi:hypothetical protein